MTKESNNRPHKYYKTNNFVSFYYLSTEKKNGQVSWQWQRTKANTGKILNGDIAFKEIKKKKGNQIRGERLQENSRLIQSLL